MDQDALEDRVGIKLGPLVDGRRSPLEATSWLAVALTRREDTPAGVSSRVSYR